MDFFSEIQKAVLEKAPKNHVLFATPNIPYWNTTGSWIFDAILRQRVGIPGGFPGGKFVELFGKEGTTKTGTGLRAMKAAITAGGIGVYIGSEDLDEEHARLFGIDIHNPQQFIPIRCYSLEGAAAAVEGVVYRFCEETIVVDGEKQPIPVVVLLDSLSALGTASSTMDNSQIGDSKTAAGEAKTLHDFFRRGVLFYLGQTRITIIFTRHSTSSPRPLSGSNLTTHGSAPNFQAYVRLKLSAKPMEPSRGKIPGYYITYKCIKSKIGPGLWEHSVPFYLDRGFCVGGEVVQLLKNNGIATPQTSGSRKTGRLVINDQAKYEWEWVNLYLNDTAAANELNSLVWEYLANGVVG